MKLHEYLSKRLFAKFGVPIPNGKIATTPEEAKTIAAELGGKVVIKSQVLVGGRGKAGGIKVVNDPDEAYKAAEKILALEIKGIPVDLVLIDEASSIQTEIYLGITNDRAARKPVMMASAAGGVDIEEVAASTPEKIIKTHIDPVMGLMSHNILGLALGIELNSELWRDFNKIAQGLWEAFKYYDATLAEINPLVVTEDNHLLALDGKMVIDDSSLFRHKDLIKKQQTSEAHQTEIDAKEYGLTYIKLDGDIGCMVNGAGLAMATMDIIKYFGGAPANFLDIGGGANEAMVAAALKIIISDPNVKTILINIFGGITRCDLVAKGILSALEDVKTDLPIIIRLVGTNAEEGRAIIAKADLLTATTLADAAQKSVEASKEASR